MRGIFALSLVALLLAPALAQAQENKEVWTDPNDPTLPRDFQIQGEYVGQTADGKEIGCQIIALSGGRFQAVILPGGLPGAGWDGENKSLMDGRLEEEKGVFEPASGDKQYLAQSSEKFSATRKFPPQGQKPYSGVLEKEVLTLKAEDGATIALKKTLRESDTIGKKAPEGAVVLFGAKESMEHWNGGRFDEQTALLNTDGKDIVTKEKFNNYTMHIEFMLPYRPAGRGQGRGNSGFYQVDHYEVQVLDSFGLEGVDNECGGVYTKASPSVNMCLPPLVWQTYDVEFTNAVRDDQGNKAKNARITLRHNGVVIHDDVEISGPTGGHRSDPEGTPGPIKLQGHGNPLQYRNIWIVKKD
jgi:hypothetical protein